MKILIVEDMESFQATWVKSVRDVNPKIQCLSAHNLTQARMFFVENPDIGIVVVDGALNDGENGLDFVKAIRAQFHGKIIAASGDDITCLDMVKAGADLSCRGNKSLVATIIKEAL